MQEKFQRKHNRNPQFLRKRPFIPRHIWEATYLEEFFEKDNKREVSRSQTSPSICSCKKSLSSEAVSSGLHATGTRKYMRCQSDCCSCNDLGFLIHMGEVFPDQLGSQIVFQRNIARNEVNFKFQTNDLCSNSYFLTHL